ncbi:D-amino-acid oxidase [Pseudohyphozyma bogoriensis]|nr:D-amino-acid oxidase [Pseudohyphozyma bogoriensis]
MAPTNPSCIPSVVVLGAGCVGLTTAIALLEAGTPVIVLAAHLPGDPLTPVYASTAAGAHHLSFAADDDWRQRTWDMETFDVLWKESDDFDVAQERGLLRLKQTELYQGDTHLRFMEGMPDFQILAPLPGYADHCVSFTSLTIEPARYLPFLQRRFLALGGILTRVPLLPSLEAALAYHPQALALVNCTGIGSRALKEVKDLTVHPVRGHVLAVDTPWVRSGWTRQVGSLAGGEGGERTYVIPRASGEVIIGGTREKDDWTETPRPETTLDILSRAAKLCPSLTLPPSSATAVDLSSLIKKEVVGYRPTRDAGVRLEKDGKVAGVPIVHNYGHGGYGWQSCWGCAKEAKKLVGEVIREGKAKAKL